MDRMNPTVEVILVNVSVEDVADEKFENVPRNPGEQRFIPDWVGKQIAAALGLEGAQDHDSRRRAGDGVEGNLSQLDEAESKIGDEGA